MFYYIVDKDYRYSHKFENKNDLLFTVCCGWSNYFLEYHRFGVDDIYTRNSYLHHFGHHFGEYKVEWDRYFDPGSSSFYHKRRKVYIKEIIIDQYNRTINLKDLAYEAWYSNPTRPTRSYRKVGENQQREKRLDLYEKRCKHLNYGKGKGYFKGVQQERKVGCDSIHKKFVRGDRNFHALDPYNMKRRGGRLKVTWKQIKVRKQWMAKQKTLTTKDN